jgi:hypothetical protein
MSASHECFIAVGGSSHDGHGYLADLESSDPVPEGDGDLPAGLGVGNDAGALGFYHRFVRVIVEAENVPAAMVVPHGAEEARHASSLRRLHAAEQITELDRSGGQVRHISLQLAEARQPARRLRTAAHPISRA